MRYTTFQFSYSPNILIQTGQTNKQTNTDTHINQVLIIKIEHEQTESTLMTFLVKSHISIYPNLTMSEFDQ